MVVVRYALIKQTVEEEKGGGERPGCRHQFVMVQLRVPPGILRHKIPMEWGYERVYEASSRRNF